MAQSSKKPGPILQADIEEYSRFNLRLPIKMREALEAEARQSGVSPSEIIRRRLEEKPQSQSSDTMKAAIEEAMSRYFSQGVPLSLEGISRDDLGETARELGFLDPAHLLKALANKAVDDPSAIKSLLFDEMKADVKTRARAELAARKKKG